MEQYDRQRARRSRNRRAAALAATVALHLLLLLVFSNAPAPLPPGQQSVQVPFVIAPRPAPQPLANYATMSPEERSEEAPDQARFMSQFNQRTDRETTVRRSEGATERGSRDRRDAAEQAARAASAPPSGAARGAPDNLGTDPAATRSPDNGRPTFVAPSAGRNGEAEAGEGVGPGAVALRNFKPSYDLPGPRPAAPESAMERDFLPLPESDRARINALQSTYWSFFERAKTRLQRNWNPARVFRRFDPDFRKLGSERATVVKITLQQDGAILEAAVSRSSGLDFLDQEALRALRAAKPFNNVPPGMLDQFGRATFEWAFIVTPEGSSTRWLGR